jgi:hypothetical protein
MFYVLGMTAVFISSRSKRIGDYAAGTFVVREGRSAVSSTTADLDDVSLWPEGSPLSAAERALVDDFLERRWSIAGEARGQLARALAARFSERLGEANPPHPEVFLEGLRSRAG